MRPGDPNVVEDLRMASGAAATVASTCLHSSGEVLAD
jgi:hypothetical protein